MSKLDWIIQSSFHTIDTIFSTFQVQIIVAIALALLGYYAGIGMLIAIGLGIIFFMVVSGMLRLPWIRDLTPTRRGTIVLILALIIGCGEFLMGKWIITREKPNIKIIDISTPNPTSPIQLYEYIIQNNNSKSVPITNITIEFIFRNNIIEAKLHPILNTGQPLLIGKHKLDVKNKDGSELHVESQPEENVITKHCSIHILQTKVNEYTINTNRLNFSCDQWSETVVYFVDITVDLSSKLYLVIKPDKLYKGTYFYEINGRQFTGKVTGTIR